MPDGTELTIPPEKRKWKWPVLADSSKMKIEFYIPLKQHIPSDEEWEDYLEKRGGKSMVYHGYSSAGCPGGLKKCKSSFHDDYPEGTLFLPIGSETFAQNQYGEPVDPKKGTDTWNALYNSDEKFAWMDPMAIADKAGYRCDGGAVVSKYRNKNYLNICHDEKDNNWSQGYSVRLSKYMISIVRNWNQKNKNDEIIMYQHPTASTNKKPRITSIKHGRKNIFGYPKLFNYLNDLKGDINEEVKLSHTFLKECIRESILKLIQKKV